jgi:hypothetical protein
MWFDFVMLKTFFATKQALFNESASRQPGRFRHGPARPVDLK